MEINVGIIGGNLTSDPELKSLPSGASVCNMSLAHNFRFKRGDEWIDGVSYFDVVVWGAQGEACAEWLRKGSHVTVEYTLRQERWETEEGQTRSVVRLNARNVKFPSKAESEASGSAADKPSKPSKPSKRSW